MPSIDSAMGADKTLQMTGSLPNQGSQPAPLVKLSVITPVERELKGGAAESFLVQLKAGEFVEINVDQEGIDVVASLFGPDGKQITRMDSPNGTHGDEPVVAIADVAGSYRIEVRSNNTRAPAGRFVITMNVQRAANSADADHIAAERAFTEGQRLRELRTAESRRAAIESFERALPYFKTSGDRGRQALALLAISSSYAESSEFRKALGTLNQILVLARLQGNSNLAGTALNLTGGAYDVLGDVDKALDFYGKALELFRQTSNVSSEASALNNIGKIYSDIAEWQKALEFLNQALPLARRLGDQRRESIVLHNIAATLYAMNEQARALDLYEQSLKLRRSIGDKAGEAEQLNSIGSVYRVLGDQSKALEYYNQALVLRRVTGDKRLEAVTLDNIGAVYAALGQPDKALAQHQQALELHRLVENPAGEAVALGNIAFAFALLHQPDKAVENYTQAFSIFRSLNDLNNQAVMLQGIASVERTRGNLAEAGRSLEKALGLFEEVRGRAGGQESRASYFASRQGAYELYIEVLMQEHAKEPTRGFDARALQTSERARARSLAELLNEGHIDIRQGVSTELTAKEKLLGQVLNAKAQRQIQLMGQMNRKEELATLSKELSELEDQYQQVQVAIRKSSPRYGALTQPQPLTLKEIQQELDPDTILLEYSLGEERSYLWAVTKDAINSYEIPKREQIKSASQKVYDLITRRGGNSSQTAATSAQPSDVADLELVKAIRDLSGMVLGPVAAVLGTKRLVVVADGALQYVPFAALSNPRSTTASNQPLIVDHEVITLPSASVLAVQRKVLAGRRQAPRSLAVMADPVFSANDERVATNRRPAPAAPTSPALATTTRLIEHLAGTSTGSLTIRRLPFTRLEADRILAVTPSAGDLKALSFRANRATATSGELSRYRYVHFATHGYLDSERPDLSALVLSLVDEKGEAQDGFLRAHEIYNLDLPAELVVLSACETGLGKDVKGEGLVGLTRGFMYAGARRVIVSLWNVNDKATAELMERLYRGMLRSKKTPAAALRAAQLDMLRIRPWQSPYYWAAFVIQGDWK